MKRPCFCVASQHFRWNKLFVLLLPMSTCLYPKYGAYKSHKYWSSRLLFLYFIQHSRSRRPHVIPPFRTRPLLSAPDLSNCSVYSPLFQQVELTKKSRKKKTYINPKYKRRGWQLIGVPQAMGASSVGLEELFVFAFPWLCLRDTQCKDRRWVFICHLESGNSADL